MTDVVRDRELIDSGIRIEIREAIASGRWPLLMVGNVGAGKTCAALALLDHVSGTTQYHTAADLTDRLRRATAKELESEQGYLIFPGDIWGLWRVAELVVLDELGSRETVSDWQYECVKRAIDEREGRPAVFISNLLIEGLVRVYDDRIASRLACGTVVKFDGPDRRMEAKNGPV